MTRADNVGVTASNPLPGRAQLAGRALGLPAGAEAR
jgi:hypothetical protein